MKLIFSEHRVVYEDAKRGVGVVAYADAHFDGVPDGAYPDGASEGTAPKATGTYLFKGWLVVKRYRPTDPTWGSRYRLGNYFPAAPCSHVQDLLGPCQLGAAVRLAVKHADVWYGQVQGLDCAGLIECL